MKPFIYILIAGLILTGLTDVSRAAGEDAVIGKIFQNQADSIVVVGVVGKRKKDSRSGTGFFVSEDGLIITNYHLIKKARRMYVKLKDNTAYTRVKVVNLDVPRDIAVLKIEGKGFKPVKLGNSDEAAIGQKVVAIGNPLGLENTVSDGLVSAIRNGATGEKMLQISVPLSNGSSGSPLFNLNGEVIGVVTASLQKGQSLNFAVPINDVKPRLRRVMDLKEPEPPAPAVAVKKIKPQNSDQAPDTDKPKPSAKIHVVKANDTLWDLARKFDTTVNALMKVNDLKSSKILIGQKLKIP
jgi:S1-C subfamily serine protease